jgi:predicted NBD/HSP70 family sugar kinase/biotin operon repressor
VPSSRAFGLGTNRDAMRRHNLATLLRHLHVDGQLSRATLTSRMGLTRSTILALVGELQALGAVIETAPAGWRASAGRPSLDVRPAEEQVVVLAAHIGADVLRAVTIGIGGRILRRAECRTPPLRDPESVASALLGLLGQLADCLPDETALLGIGASVPGMVGDNEVVRSAPSLGWTDVPFADLLRSRLHSRVPLWVANDADLGALAEHSRGAGVGHDDMIFVGCDDLGVGGGIVVAGRSFRGVGGYAGEFGHILVNPRGRVCQCGARGCWETEIGAVAVAAALGQEAKDLASLADALARVGKPSAALRTIGRYLGLGLGSIVNAFNPEIIVLGGTLRELYPVVQADTDKALQAMALDAPREQVRVVLPKLGGDAVLIGAGEMAFEPLLADPVGTLTNARREASAAMAPERPAAVQSIRVAEPRRV